MHKISIEKTTCDKSHWAIVEAARKVGISFFDEPNCETEVGQLKAFAEEIKKIEREAGQFRKPPAQATQALVCEIVQALLSDEKNEGFDLTAGLFGPEFSILVRRWAEAEWNQSFLGQFKNLYEEAMSASNEAGYVGLTPTETIKDLDTEREALKAEVAAWKWGYEYLQNRMVSIERHGWAHDCDEEIKARIASAKA